MKVNPIPDPPLPRLPVMDPSGEDKPELAGKLIDNTEDVNDVGPRAHHRVSYAWDKELERNVANTIDNKTGDVVKKAVSDAQKDHALRIEKLKGLNVDEEA